MIGHFNADDLAGYHAGTVSGSQAARISAHLSGCPQCADVSSGLADVSQLLASVRVPPMPERLTQRVHAAISSEAAQRAVNTSALGHSEAGAADDISPVLIPGRPDLPERAKRPPHRPRIRAWSSSPLFLRGLAAAGVLVLLVGGGILLANQRGVGPSSGVAAPEARPAKSPTRGTAIGSVPSTPLRYRHGAAYSYTNVVTADVNYTKAGLPAGVRQEVAHSAQIGNTGAAPATVQPQPQHMVSHTTVGRLESCLSALAAGRLVLLVEIARYLNHPATIIIFRPIGNAYDVIVVGEACGATSQDILASLAVPTK